MARTVTSAIVQVAWTGDKDSMIEQHEKYVAEAAAAGAQVMCFQELFYGPYFCQVQDADYYSYAEAIPDGPTTKRFSELAAKHEMVLVLPMYEREKAGLLYNTAAVIDADGSYLGKYRKTHIPQVQGFWEKFYFRPGNLGYPVFETAVGTVGVYICYDRHFPEGWRASWGSQAPRSCSTRRPPAGACPPTCGSWSRPPPRSPTCTTSGRSTGWGSSRSATTTSTARRTSPTRGASSWTAPRRTPAEELVVRDLDLDRIDEVRSQWAFYRDRRPDLYDPLTAP